VSQLIGRTVHIDIADLSADYMGHICVDDIVESGNRVVPVVSQGKGTNKKLPGTSMMQTTGALPEEARLLANTPQSVQSANDRAFRAAGRGGGSRRRVRRIGPPGSHVAGRRAWRPAATRSSGTAATSRVAGWRPECNFVRMRIDGAVVDTRKMMLLK
jgi:hypothetical protein